MNSCSSAVPHSAAATSRNGDRSANKLTPMNPITNDIAVSSRPPHAWFRLQSRVFRGSSRPVRIASAEDAAWRAEIAEQIGTGFTVPNCTDCTEKEKEATGAVASK